eukprot:5615589-Pyramimonas_sp.AAC.1
MMVVPGCGTHAVNRPPLNVSRHLCRGRQRVAQWRGGKGALGRRTWTSKSPPRAIALRIALELRPSGHSARVRALSRARSRAL